MLLLRNTKSELTYNKRLKIQLKNSQGPQDLIGKFYQTLKEELTLILLKLLQKIEEEGILPVSMKPILS